jgi:flagellar biosynthetic protein FlhB
MGALGVFFFAGSWMFDQLYGVLGHVYHRMANPAFGPADLHVLLIEMFTHVILILAPLLLVVAFAGVAANVVQKGFMLTGESLKPNFSKMNPLKGLKRLVSIRSLAEVAKTIFKVLFVGTVAYLMLRKELPVFPSLIHMSVGQILTYACQTALKIAFFTCLALLILAILDYAFQRWRHEEDLKMTKQEVKDEAKQREGDPQVKSRIRKVQTEMARKRSMQSVPEADVVVTNPTHLAVALKYTAGLMDAPIVVAKGAGNMALQIRRIAEEHDIPIVENKPLAQALFKAVEPGEFIPEGLYQAVAEILAYVYRLKGRARPA